MSKRLISSPWLALVAAPLLAIASSGAETATNSFGFLGKEVFPIDPQIGHLEAGDMNGDELLDLVLINNSRSKITILLNRTGATNAANVDETRLINDLPADARFKIDSIASEKRISSIVVADLNSDGKTDLAYYGEPRELVIQYNEGTNGWSALKRFAIEDATLDPYALNSGDLNGDGRTDLVLLAEDHVYYFPQDKEGLLGEPERIPYAGVVKAAKVMDIQGDGREDLLLVNWDNPNPFRVRLQHDEGRLGPEMQFALPPIRAYWADDLDGDKKAEIITIAQKSGRAQLLQFSTSKGEPLVEDYVQGQFQLLPLPRTKKARRGVAWADLNADGRPDLLTSEPDSGQLSAYLQSTNGSMKTARTFSTLTGVGDIAVADWDGDKRPEIFVLSNDERQVGVTAFDEKENIAFPRNLPLPGRPLALAAGAIRDTGHALLAVIVDLDGKRELQFRSPTGPVGTHKFSESFKATPNSLLLHDVNQDGRTDLVILVPYEKIKMLVQREDGSFDEVDLAPPGGSAEQPWATTGDIDGDGKSELLLAQKNFLRAVVLQREGQLPAGETPPAGEGVALGSWTFSVREQINGAAANSRIVAAAALPQKEKQPPIVFLLDAERKALTVTARNEAGAWRNIKNVALPITDFTSLEPIKIGSASAIAFLGLNAAAWLPLAGETWELRETDGYETPIKDGYLNDLVSGDLNNDEQKDLIFLETAKSHIDIVTFQKPNQLVPANRWQVFEERTFRSRRNDNAEPREALVADFTGDGKNDLVILVHDRVILYPQE